jgi:hypothetical protein
MLEAQLEWQKSAILTPQMPTHYGWIRIEKLLQEIVLEAQLEG